MVERNEMRSISCTILFCSAFYLKMYFFFYFLFWNTILFSYVKIISCNAQLTNFCSPFKRQPHKMVKHTQTVDELLELVWPFCGIGAKRVNCLSHFLRVSYQRANSLNILTIFFSWNIKTTAYIKRLKSWKTLISNNLTKKVWTGTANP